MVWVGRTAGMVIRKPPEGRVLRCRRSIGPQKTSPRPHAGHRQFGISTHSLPSLVNRVNTSVTSLRTGAPWLNIFGGVSSAALPAYRGDKPTAPRLRCTVYVVPYLSWAACSDGGPSS